MRDYRPIPYSWLSSDLHENSTTGYIPVMEQKVVMEGENPPM